MIKRVWRVADSLYDLYKGPFWVVWQEPISGEPASIASAKWGSSGQAPNRFFEALDAEDRTSEASGFRRTNPLEVLSRPLEVSGLPKRSLMGH